jgi:hypothetical protein
MDAEPDDLDAFRQARCGSTGASDVPDIVRRTKTGYSATRANLMALKVLERLTGVAVPTYQSKAMADGLAKEPLARAAYAFLHEVAIERAPPPGLIPHPLIAGAHASPDGLVGLFGLIEVKCPEHAAHLDTLLSETIEKDYRVQIQWQLACTGRQWCDYVSWHPDFPASMQFWEQRVERDPDFISELEGEVRTFLAELERKVAELRKRYELAEAA